MRVQCAICPHKCILKEGQMGFCRARMNKGGSIICENYAKLTALALDPIEKKPLYHFYPGSNILSVGSYGCNLRCPFCQNYEISMCDGSDISYEYYTPEKLVQTALSLKRRDNIGIAYTYNEPLISYEYVLDCAFLAREHDLKNVLVTNGYICKQPLETLLPYIDAMNIDLKSFNPDFYKKISGDLETVKSTIKTAAKLCHTEITTLIIPDENDSKQEMEQMAQWIADIDVNIPYHISAFYPRYKYIDKKAATRSKVYDLAQTAKRYLKHVYIGNC